LETVPSSQRIRPFAPAGAFFYEGKGVEGHEGAVEGAADVERTTDSELREQMSAIAMARAAVAEAIAYALAQPENANTGEIVVRCAAEP
jgi:NADP-dependent 3-hydroxy acid dehydrogenase YdfG